MCAARALEKDGHASVTVKGAGFGEHAFYRGASSQLGVDQWTHSRADVVLVCEEKQAVVVAIRKALCVAVIQHAHCFCV